MSKNLMLVLALCAGCGAITVEPPYGVSEDEAARELAACELEGERVAASARSPGASGAAYDRAVSACLRSKGYTEVRQ